MGKKEKPRKPSQSPAELKRIIRRLLESLADIYQGGESLPNFEAKGPAGPEGFPLNVSYLLRHFQDHPNELKAIKRRLGDSDEAASHIWLEAQMIQLREEYPCLTRWVDDIHFRSTAGTKDGDFWIKVKENMALKGNRKAAIDLWHYNQCIEELAQRHRDDVEAPDLFAPMIRRKAIRDADKMEETNRDLYDRFLDLTNPEYGDGMKIKDAYGVIEDQFGVGRRRAAQIVASQREQHGEAPRKPGQHGPRQIKKGE